ncbi:MAG: hypothetical protein OXI01_01005, partial [Albidovulum sp.]|nr:hypothetical protein [Albidovulum sp.]
LPGHPTAPAHGRNSPPGGAVREGGDETGVLADGGPATRVVSGAMAAAVLSGCNRPRELAGQWAEDAMAQGRDGGRQPGGRGRNAGTPMLPADLERSLRHLDDAELDRLVDAATAEARRRGRQAGKTSGVRGRGKPKPVTAGQEKLILAAFEAGLKPAAIAREFRLSRAQVDGVLAGAGHGRR